MERKKILWLCSWYPSKEDPFNGDFIQRHARAASLYNDIHVIHVTYDYPAGKALPPPEIRATGNLTEHIICYKRKRSLPGRFTGHFNWQSLYKRAIRNYIIKNGKPDLVHVQVPMKAGLLGLWLKKNYKLPYLVTEHWGIYNDIISQGYPDMGFLFKQYTRKIFSNADGFTSVSTYLAEGVNRLVGPVPYTVIPNVVDTDLFYHREHTHPVFRFIHVSNMVPLKNVEGILRSFKKLLQSTNQAELVLVGKADKQLQEYADRLAISPGQLRFTGEVNYPQVAIEMQNADSLVQFSTIENAPCVISEALCCGLPVIATAVGGIPEMVDESKGILIPANDEEALTKAMYTLLQEKSRYNSKLIAETAAQRYSYPVVGKKIDTLCQAVLKKVQQA